LNHQNIQQKYIICVFIEETEIKQFALNDSNAKNIKNTHPIVMNNYFIFIFIFI